ncbi:GPW/gp25 family protein [Fluviicola sp.]|jgi:phage baseplate assembly protein W|uniref:GPW/gp25 family protein n=1 Tax=Fluviicola sp. TaxID=1917219 RepID=UPI00282EDBF4|nr:GPW/gp25 family protein [Fluviicola sp.]MDR0802975.1 GPW/gp25 family protein [Fluviicola sp.]
MNEKTYLGTGWGFPVRFHQHGVQLVSDEEDIRESLRILFSTIPGERVFRYSYGCPIDKWVFSKIDLSERTMVIDIIEQAIREGEPRIITDLVDVEIRDAMEGILWIQVDFTIRQTNSRSSMVYPFYFLEGTQL